MTYTCKDIARKTGVSISTVSRVLNKKDLHKVGERTRKKVEKIIKKTNYTPNIIAKSLVSKKSFSVAVALEDFKDVVGPYFSQIISGIAYVLQENGYYLQLLGTVSAKNKPLSQHYLQAVKERRVDGVIILSEAINEKEILGLWKDKFPVLLVNRYIRDKEIPSVLMDNEKGLYDVTSELAKLGHRKIVFMAGCLKYQLDQDRLKGYKKALKENNIEFDEKYVLEGYFKYENAANALNVFISQGKKFSAVAASDDVMAFACITTLKKNNLSVPADVSVTGFNDMLFLPAVNPTLTSLKVPLIDMGKEAAAKILEIIDGKQIPDIVSLFKPQLVKRQSISSPHAD
ncbi:MAG: LacI family DNA-binding transcriptional regulator [bacterium]|nr:LacI family DNA-binding transcriptional regulator [bacterium]